MILMIFFSNGRTIDKLLTLGKIHAKDIFCHLRALIGPSGRTYSNYPALWLVGAEGVSADHQVGGWQL